jgi:hypothetical protein
MGLKKAAVARLCLNGDIYRAMPEVCVQYLPKPTPPPVPARYAQASIRGAALHHPRHLGDARGDRQKTPLQRLRCDPAELPCLGSHRPPFGTEEGDGEW